MAEDAGATDLSALVRGMTPRLRAAEYVFCRFARGTRPPENLVALATFEEDEGTTAIVERVRAERHGLAGVGPYAMITLEVHSSLEAVGFLAAVTRALAAAEIPANAVSAFHHDHLFVPAHRAQDALAVLERLAANA